MRMTGMTEVLAPEVAIRREHALTLQNLIRPGSVPRPMIWSTDGSSRWSRTSTLGGCQWKLPITHSHLMN